MKTPNNIEELFKSSFDGFEGEVDPQMWSRVQAQIPSSTAISGAESVAKLMAVKTSSIITAAVALSVVGVVGFAIYIADQNVQDEPATELNQLKSAEELIVEPISSPKETETKAELDIKTDVEKKNTQRPETQVETKAPSTVETKSEKQNDLVNNRTVSNATAPKQTDDQVINEILESNKASQRSEQTIQSEGSAIANEISQNYGSIDEGEAEEADAKLGTTENITKSDNPKPDNNIKTTEALDYIESYKAPNVFTPNQDGYHDVYRIDLDGIDELEVAIFSKTGKLIHEWKGLYGYWDGTMPDGTPAINDTYIYQILITKDGKQYPKKGMLSLLR